jgi:hypothetical protein
LHLPFINTGIRSEQLEKPFGQFAAIGDNILGCESVAQGEMLEEKTSVRKSRETAPLIVAILDHFPVSLLIIFIQI